MSIIISTFNYIISNIRVYRYFTEKLYRYLPQSVFYFDNRIKSKMPNQYLSIFKYINYVVNYN